MSTQRTALLSAYHKDGLETFARSLHEFGVNILASDGTATFLRGNNIPCSLVSGLVGPPILGHRVVTLSREVHAGLLATDSADDRAELARINAPRIDLVYVDLYPLRQEIERPGHTLQSVLDKTDIGGPVLLRSAAKGRRLALSSSHQFKFALRYVSGEFDDQPLLQIRLISALACVAENVVASYCRLSADYHQEIAGREAFETITE